MNELQKINAEAQKKLTTLSKEFQSEIETWYFEELQSGNLYPNAADAPFNTGLWLDRTEEITTDAIIKSVEIGLGESSVIASVQETSKYFLDLKIEGVTLSSRLRDTAREAEKITTQIINDHISAKTTVKRIADDLTRNTISKGDLPKWLTEMNQAVIDANGDSLKIRSILKKANANLEKMTLEQQPMSKLRKAYTDVVKAVEKGDQSAISKKLEKAYSAKVTYNNERIAKDQTARAYSQAFQRQLVVHPEYDTGRCYIKSLLSFRHRIIDNCDFYASADTCGQGKGVWRAEDLPANPYHIGCNCSQQIVVLDEEVDLRTAKYSDARANEYFEKIPEKKAQVIKKSMEIHKDLPRVVLPKKLVEKLI